MEGKEPDSKYLMLWLCVFLTAGIVFVGWFVAIRSNFAKTNAEMNGNVNKTFEEAQQEVMDSFEQVHNFIKQTDEKTNDDAEIKKLSSDLGINETDAGTEEIKNEETTEAVK